MQEGGGWYRLAHRIMRRPLPIAFAATALLVALGIPFFSIRFTGVDAAVLPPQASSRVVDTALRRDFAPTAVTPVYAVVRGTAGDARTYAAALGRQPGGRAGRLAEAAWPGDVGGAGVVGLDLPRRAVAAPRPQMRDLPGGALVGGATAQFIDQRHAIGSSLPLALALCACRRTRCSTSRPARSSCRSRRSS